MLQGITPVTSGVSLKTCEDDLELFPVIKFFMTDSILTSLAAKRETYSIHRDSPHKQKCSNQEL